MEGDLVFGVRVFEELFPSSPSSLPAPVPPPPQHFRLTFCVCLNLQLSLGGFYNCFQFSKLVCCCDEANPVQLRRGLAVALAEASPSRSEPNIRSEYASLLRPSVKLYIVVWEVGR
jgi:hypothetical protein